MSNGHRWSKFWWQDWQRDEGLRSCSFAAQGLWMRLLCIAYEAEPRGYVLINGKPPTFKRLAMMAAGATEREVVKLIAELEAEGVFSRTDDGTIFSRRMVRDTAEAAAQRDFGKMGGNPSLKPKPNGGDNGQDNRGVNPPNNGPNQDGLMGAFNQSTEAESEAEERTPPKSPSSEGDLRSRARRHNHSGKKKEAPRFASGAIELVYREGVARRAAAGEPADEAESFDAFLAKLR